MKPRNFPERVNRRRKSAHQTLIANGGNLEEVAVLKERIVPDARSVRTKKQRSVGRK